MTAAALYSLPTTTTSVAGPKINRSGAVITHLAQRPLSPLPSAAAAAAAAARWHDARPIALLTATHTSSHLPSPRLASPHDVVVSLLVALLQPLFFFFFFVIQWLWL